MKLFVYNFGGIVYETHEAFDSTFYRLSNEAKSRNATVTRQVIDGNKITNQIRLDSGIWVDE